MASTIAQTPDAHSALDALAWRICADENRIPVLLENAEERATLECHLATGALLEDERGVRFSDEGTLVAAATKHLLSTKGDHLLSSPTACFEQLDDVFALEIGKQHRVSACALAELHNTGRISGFVWARQAIEGGVGCFNVLHVMEGAVSLFNTCAAQDIYEFFTAHYDQVKNDLAGSIVYVKLSPWLGRFPEIAHTLKRIYEASPNEKGASLYACALHGLVLNCFDDGFDLALGAARSANPMVSGPALHMLGLVGYEKPPHPKALEQVIDFCAEIVRTAGHAQLEVATRTLGRLLPTAETRVSVLLEQAAQTEVPAVLYALSEALWRTQEELRDRAWFWPLYLRLAAAKAEHKGTLNNIDLVLMGWIRKPERQEKVLEFLNRWISRQPHEVIRDAPLEKLFDATLHHLSGQPQLLNRAITAWLLNDDRRYPMVAFRVISRLPEPTLKSLAVDVATIDNLQSNEIRFLVRRILGFIVGDEPQIRLLFSLVRTRDSKTRTLGFVKGALQDHIGQDFPQQTLNYLRERQVDEVSSDVKILCSEVVSVLESRLAALDALPDLKELAPSFAKIHRFAKERAKQMGKAFDDASKESIFRQLTTHVVLKAGRRTFQSQDNRYTEPMELKGISHTIALPLSEIFDPTGAARNRYLFKLATKDAQ